MSLPIDHPAITGEMAPTGTDLTVRHELDEPATAAMPVTAISVSPIPGPVEPVPASGPANLLLARIRELHYLAGRVMDSPVIGARGQQMTVAEAREHARARGSEIDMAEMRGSQRHRKVAGHMKALALLLLVVIDFPVMLWLASSVFNVDWSDPLGLPLLISIVISLLATGGAAASLHHLGHNLRDAKTDRRQLDWSEMSVGSRVSLAGVVLLVAMIACVMFVRVFTEGSLSGLDGLAVLLAILVAFVMMISAGLVFWTAFRDGSPEQDDLEFYSTLVQQHLNRKRQYEDEAMELANQYELCVHQGTLRDDAA